MFCAYTHELYAQIQQHSGDETEQNVDQSDTGREIIQHCSAEIVGHVVNANTLLLLQEQMGAERNGDLLRVRVLACRRNSINSCIVT